MVGAEVDAVLQATLTVGRSSLTARSSENTRVGLSRDQQACLVCDVRLEDPWA